MNVRHFLAFVWLRWRIRINQFKRAGVGGMVVLAILAPFIVTLPFILFGGLMLVGTHLLPKAPAVIVVLIWDVLALGFLFWWCLGLVTELQRSEALSLNKFLHLPVSLKGAFLVNYLGSLVNLTLVMFLPAMAGLALGMIISYGPAMIVLVFAVPAFFLMITALTYQFQGWLASLMVNKRRRRTIIVVFTATFVLVAQLPNLLNILRPWDSDEEPYKTRFKNEQAENRRLRDAGTITEEQFRERSNKLEQERKDHDEVWERDIMEQVGRIAWIANIVLPVGWLPLAAWTAMDGNVLPGMLGTFGMGLIGAISLRRSYRTTVKLYTGQYTSGGGQAISSSAGPTAAQPPLATKSGGKPQPAESLERVIPWLSEQATAITLGTFRSLLRAPEAKMMLLTPLLMVIIFGGMVLTRTGDIPQRFRPPLAFAAVGMVLFGMMNSLGNQFGFDRNGFRVFVLCSASRRDILLGKNLGFAPLMLAPAALAILLIQMIQPMRLDDLLALAPLIVSMYLVFCLMANFLSIYAPMPIAAGSLRPSRPRLVPVLLQLLAVLLIPFVEGPLLAPLVIQLILEALGILEGWPIFLALSLVECVIVIFLYRIALRWQGSILQTRERQILEVVMTKAE